MTGYGEARHQGDSLTVSVELRSVNNRYLKVSVRASEPYNLLEPEVEKVVRRAVRRGTVQVQMRVERPPRAQDFTLNTAALASYLDQLQRVCEERRLPPEVSARMYAEALMLPGV